MKRYIAIIEYAEEDGVFDASFPDAPGCTASGATEDEVMNNAFDALAEWVADERADGRTVPEPRSYLELLKSGEYGLGKGGMFAPIPLVLETGTVARANISIDTGLLTAIDEAASKKGITRSAFLAAAARERIKASA